jgi:hypothetical protein
MGVPHPPADGDNPPGSSLSSLTSPTRGPSKRWPRIANDVTLLINNAGMASSATLLGGSIDDVRAPMESHFFGTLSVTRASAPHLIANPQGGTQCCFRLVLVTPELWAQTDVVREEFEPRRLGDGPAHRIHGYPHGRGYRRRESGRRHHHRHSMHRQTTIRFAAPSLRTQLVPIRLPPPACGCALLVAERESFSQITRIHARAVEPRRRTA